MNDNNTKGPEQVDYLDLNHRYYIVMALSKENEDHLFDCQFFGDDGEIKDGFEGFWFDEKMFIQMEQYFFNFIDAECNLLITMYEEEYVSPEQLPQVIDVVKRMIKECDNDEVLTLAKKLLDLLDKAQKLNMTVGFCF